MASDSGRSFCARVEAARNLPRVGRFHVALACLRSAGTPAREQKLGGLLAGDLSHSVTLRALGMHPNLIVFILWIACKPQGLHYPTGGVEGYSGAEPIASQRGRSSVRFTRQVSGQTTAPLGTASAAVCWFCQVARWMLLSHATRSSFRGRYPASSTAPGKGSRSDPLACATPFSEIASWGLWPVSHFTPARIRTRRQMRPKSWRGRCSSNARTVRTLPVGSEPRRWR
jgi:hypothetical protein